MVKHVVFACILVALVTGPDRVLASCGAASCPINNYHSMREGWVGLSFMHEYINQDRIFVGSSRSFVGAIPGHHDEVQTLNDRDVLELQMGITSRFDLSVTAPFVHREHTHLQHNPGGDAWETWNFSGLGDVVVAGHATLLAPSNIFSPRVSLTGALKLPTGVTNAIDAEGEPAEITIQPGTGSLDGIVGINCSTTLLSVPMLSGEYSALPLELGVTLQANGKGKDGYRFGTVLLAHLGSAYQFAQRGSFLLQLNTRIQGYADVGTTDEPRANTGGTWAYISPGVQLELTDDLVATSFVQLPVYQNVHGIQQTAAFNLLFRLSYSLDLLATD